MNNFPSQWQIVPDNRQGLVFLLFKYRNQAKKLPHPLLNPRCWSSQTEKTKKDHTNSDTTPIISGEPARKCHQITKFSVKLIQYGCELVHRLACSTNGQSCVKREGFPEQRKYMRNGSSSPAIKKSPGNSTHLSIRRSIWTNRSIKKVFPHHRGRNGVTDPLIGKSITQFCQTNTFALECRSCGESKYRYNSPSRQRNRF